VEKRTLIRDIGILESEGSLSGHFAVVDSPYEITEGIREVIDRCCIDGIDLRGDIRALWNHDSSIVLGRTSSNTLSFYPDELGLFGRISINSEDSQARDCWARVKRGDVSGCSIGFYPKEVVEVREADGSWTFHIRRMDLVEVTVCAFPAYTATDIHARSAEVIEKQKVEQLNRAIRRAELIGRLKNVDSRGASLAQTASRTGNTGNRG
jgi:HK97 family phage prohead protease